ncbi:MAG: hypothetical protein AB1782_17775 [Cyanobacteriota bacterium]
MRLLLIILLMIGSLTLIISPVIPETFKECEFKPFDEAYIDPGFVQFRNMLLQIIEDKDAKALMPFVAKDIFFSFGIDKGKENFIKKWDLNNNNSSVSKDFWYEFEKVVKNGGKFVTSEEFIAPYYSTDKWPPGFNSFDFVVVTGKDVNVYKKENDSLLKFSTISYKIVKMLKWASFKYNDREYSKVLLPDGKEAYIYDYYLGNQIGFRATFARDNDNKWEIVIFVGGD